MIALHLLIGAVMALYGLWILYLAIMALYSARESKSLTAWAARLAYPILMLGYLVDFLVNVTLLSVIMLEVPQELLVTSRLTRHINDESSWRKSVATWICQNLLDFADPSGCHCKKHKE